MYDSKRLKELIDNLPTRTKYLISYASKKDEWMRFYKNNITEIVSLIGIHKDPICGTRREQAEGFDHVRKRLEEIYLRL